THLVLPGRTRLVPGRGRCRRRPPPIRPRHAAVQPVCIPGVGSLYSALRAEKRDGRLPERPMGADCKSVGESLRRFESYTCHREPPWIEMIRGGSSVSGPRRLSLARACGSARSEIPALTSRFGTETGECVTSFKTSKRRGRESRVS